MLPNSRSDRETGLATSATVSRIKLNAMMNGAKSSPMPLVGGAIGCSVRSLIRPSGPFAMCV